MNRSLRLRLVAAAAVLLPITNVQIAAAAPADSPKLVPVPASVKTTPETSFTLTKTTPIVGSGPAAEHLAGILRRSTGYPFPIVADGAGIKLSRSGDPAMGQEAYKLDVTGTGVTLTARTEEGLFRGVQTFRQLLPPKVEASTVQPGPWTIGGVSITDQPRFGWRGVMLDVARHFYSVTDVKRFIDQAALYKVNVLHLHLADDQGWRIQIDSWPRLATYGGSTEVGGGPGGHYTKQDYADIVRYAGERFMTVVPEIDMPGHTNAALASYAELNCNGIAPPLYTGTNVGFSSLCTSKEITYRFIDDVIREVAAMTPGPYLHIGGDEAHSTSHDDYVAFINRVGGIVTAHGKKMIGWQEIGQATLPADTTGQYWGSATHANSVVAKGGKIVFSPPGNAYLDMKYNAQTPYGLDWAGHVDVERAYGWDPATIVNGIGDTQIRGVEAPLWTETIADIEAAEFMTNPRLAAIAEIGWSPASTHNWDDFRIRLAAHGARWDTRDTTYYRSTQVPWNTERFGPIVGTGSGRCVDVPGSTTANETQLILWDCHNAPNQTWQIRADGSVRSLGKCMDVKNANSNDGTPIQLYNCNNTPAQTWTYDLTTKTLRALGKCLDVKDEATGNNAQLILWSCHGRANQQWDAP